MIKSLVLDQSPNNEALTSSGDFYGSCSMLPIAQKGHLASVDTDPEEYQLPGTFTVSFSQRFV